MLFFDWAQTFYLDKSAVQNATEIAITRVDLYFRAKPPATNNKSGIYKPGVELRIVPTINGIPVINQMGAYRPTEPTEHGAKFSFYSTGQTSRVEYDEIVASLNPNVPVSFLFPSPVFVPTNGEYAAVIKFDGSENFVLWSSVTGEKLVGSAEVSKGPSGNFKGTLFSFIDDPNKTSLISNTNGYAYSNVVVNPAQGNNSALLYGADVLTNEGWDTTYLQSSWRKLTGEYLKMDVFVARYAINGVPIQTLPEYEANNLLTSAYHRPVSTAPVGSAVSNGVLVVTAPVQVNEYVYYNMQNSTKGQFVFGEPFCQDGPRWPGDKTPLTINCYPTVAGGNTDYLSHLIQANSSYLFPNGVTFDASGGFFNLTGQDGLLIVRDGANLYLKQVVSIVSNSQVLIREPFNATLTNVTFSLAPVGALHEVAKTLLFGRETDLLTLYNSTANSSVRFTSYSIANVVIANGGNNYSNNDYIKIDGFEDRDYSVKGNYSAYANIVTAANGMITNVYFSNTGSGFSNINWLQGANVHIYKSTAGVPSVNPSNGTTANITFQVGSSIKSLFGGTVFANTVITNLEVMRMKPEIWVNNPLGTSYKIRHRTRYYSVPDTNVISGKAYYVDTAGETLHTDTVSKIFKAVTLNNPAEGETPVLMSRSNEFVTRFADGTVNDANTWGKAHSNTAVFLFDISSNSDFQAIWFDPEVIMSHYGKYIINPDYTDEHTNYGNAWAKHIATKINLASNSFAEDIVVYLNAYRPANTDFKVYARVHNAADPDAFDDTDWTLLEQIDGIGMYSSKQNSSDYVELTYNLPAYPNTDFTLAGSVTLRQGNSHVIGNTTIFGPKITIVDGGTGYTNGDIIYFTAPTTVYNDHGITASKRSANATATVSTNATGGITALAITNVGFGWTSQANVTGYSALRANGSISAGTSASLKFAPGLQAGDLIKIYSAYTDWANANYTTAVVNSVISNTDITVKRTFGEISANLVGNINISSASSVVVGTATQFQSTFTTGDYIAIWANSSTYETHQIVSITDNTHLTMDSNSTFTNTATFYAYVTPDTFMNASLAVAGLLVDRVAYPHQAFNAVQNDNVARYYNSTMVEFDAYDTLQIKLCLMGDNDIIVPKCDDVRGVCVTA